MAISDSFSSLGNVDYNDISSWPYILKIFASLLLGIAILVGIFFVFYQPKMKEIETAETKESNLKVEFERKQKLAVNLPAYEEQMIEIKDRFDEVLRKLPDQSEVPALLKDISEAGLEQGLVFERFKPARPEQKNFYVQLPIEIEAAGGYHQLASFISAIANFDRVVTLGDLEISRNKSNTETDINKPLDFSANLYTYHYSEQENLDAQNNDNVSRITQ